jgi:selenocysteine lyase/cysteine desulfurase
MARHAADQRDFWALHWREWYAEIDRVRESAAKLIGARAEEIAILKNTSEGLSFVAEGLRWREGDNVVTSAMEFPSNWTPWKRLEARGVECRVAIEPTVDAIAPLLDDCTRIVSVSSVAFHNGFTADLDAIGELCASRGVLFCVHAIQSDKIAGKNLPTAGVTEENFVAINPGKVAGGCRRDTSRTTSTSVVGTVSEESQMIMV